MKRKKQLPAWDDGRTVADMNVEGCRGIAPTAGKKSTKKISRRARKSAP